MRADALRAAGEVLLVEEDAADRLLAKPYRYWKRTRSLRQAEGLLRNSAIMKEDKHTLYCWGCSELSV
jgi:hypothetical protein